ncbi:hypothetical protein [Virgibacillus ihumii]|uniref:hypothetical protein n=1 Tax=Virgibacillus ihumii TaxID=2686091 RepID=UPI00157DDDE7|nr:hypothetical protein [Virgibacillus ihumii]
MFNMAEFLKTNLINGYREGSFTRTQITIFAINYQSKGWLTQEDVNDVLEAIQPKEEAQMQI